MNMDQRAKIKNHFIDNKKVYIAAGVGILVGAASAVLIIANRPEAKIITDAWKLQINSPTTNNVTTIIEFIERSTPSKPIHLVGTQKYWDSIRATARDTGYSVSDISKNVNGLRDSVKGSVFEFAA
jgi:hypothetical protein